MRTAFPALTVVMRRRMRIYEDDARESRERIVAAIERLEAELSPSGYLVGDSFTVADLTAASLMYPIVLPAEFPYPSATEVPSRGPGVPRRSSRPDRAAAGSPRPTGATAGHPTSQLRLARVRNLDVGREALRRLFG